MTHDHTEGDPDQCPADAPYYWSGWSDTFSSQWHIVTENLLVEKATHGNFTISSTQATGSLSLQRDDRLLPGAGVGLMYQVVHPRHRRRPEMPLGPKRSDCTGCAQPQMLGDLDGNLHQRRYRPDLQLHRRQPAQDDLRDLQRVTGSCT